MLDPSSLTDDDLKAALLKHGVKAGPIVGESLYYIPTTNTHFQFVWHMDNARMALVAWIFFYCSTQVKHTPKLYR